MKLDLIIGFLTFTNSFRKTERAILAVDDNRNENDVEHSYQLTVFALFLNDQLGLKLNMEKLMAYALFHDMDETFFGDIDIFNSKARLDKDSKAKMAREKIISQFPSWETYNKYSTSYNELVDDESRFINGLDKILPVLNIILDQGRTWHREDTTLEMIIQNKRPKVRIHPVVNNIWKEIEAHLKDHELELFGKLS